MGRDHLDDEGSAGRDHPRRVDLHLSEENDRLVDSLGLDREGIASIFSLRDAGENYDLALDSVEQKVSPQALIAYYGEQPVFALRMRLHDDLQSLINSPRGHVQTVSQTDQKEETSASVETEEQAVNTPAPEDTPAAAPENTETNAPTEPEVQEEVDLPVNDEAKALIRALHLDQEDIRWAFTLIDDPNSPVTDAWSTPIQSVEGKVSAEDLQKWYPDIQSSFKRRVQLHNDIVRLIISPHIVGDRTAPAREQAAEISAQGTPGQDIPAEDSVTEQSVTNQNDETNASDGSDAVNSENTEAAGTEAPKAEETAKTAQADTAAYNLDDLSNTPYRVHPAVGDVIWINGKEYKPTANDPGTLIGSDRYVYVHLFSYTLDGKSAYDLAKEDPRNAGILDYISSGYGLHPYIVSNSASELHKLLSPHDGIFTNDEKDKISALFDENLGNAEIAKRLTEMFAGQVREFTISGNGTRGIWAFDDDGLSYKTGENPWTSADPYSIVPTEDLVAILRYGYLYNRLGLHHAPLAPSRELQVGDVVYLRNINHEPAQKLTLQSIEPAVWGGVHKLHFTDESGKEVEFYNDHVFAYGMRHDVRNERYIFDYNKEPFSLPDDFLRYLRHDISSKNGVNPYMEAYQAYLDRKDDAEIGHVLLDALKGQDNVLQVPQGYYSRNATETEKFVASSHGLEVYSALFPQGEFHNPEEFGAWFRYAVISNTGSLVPTKQALQDYQNSKKKLEAHNYHINPDAVKSSSLKERFRTNVNAINTLKAIEAENRSATPDEQDILAGYTGWGGLADAFDPSKPAWHTEYLELQSLLTSDEYDAAKSTVLNAFYTAPDVISGIYDAVQQMGFKNGSILEPSMGVGNFFGMLPEAMSGSKLSGVELDSITGRIAKQLYPDADIRIGGFETTTKKDAYDLAVGNVPFGEYQVNDPEFNKYGFSIHNYFFAKTLSEVRPGGMIAFVTSRYTLDAQNSTAREYMAKNAEFIGAIRLPNNAFGNTNTNVVSDIIFLKKREQPIEDITEEKWVGLDTDSNGFVMNEYFAAHPEMVLGTPKMVSSRFGQTLTVEPFNSGTLKERLKDAIRNLSGTYQARTVGNTKNDHVIDADGGKPYSFIVNKDGKVYYRKLDTMTEVTDTKNLGRIRGLIELRDAARNIIDLQASDATDTEIKAAQAKLNIGYDSFVNAFGRLNSKDNQKVFSKDSGYSLLCALEVLDSHGGFERKADLFSKRTITKPNVVTHTDTAAEALAVSINTEGAVDMPYIARLTGKTEAQAEKELEGVVFLDPATNDYVTADEYLSGNIREKLGIARANAASDPKFEVNIKALQEVMPKDLTASEIDVRLGATWIKPSYISDFMRETFQLSFGSTVDCMYSPITSEWKVKTKDSYGFGFDQINRRFGTKRKSAFELMENALNLRETKVYDTVKEDGKEKKVLNKRDTMEAAAKTEELQRMFKDWIFKDPARRDTLVELYNEKFNSIRPREYDGSALSFPGSNPEIHLKPYQKDAVAHVLFGGNTLLAHCVGAGKTYEMAASAMEMKRLGLCNKPMFVVPNHLLEQWSAEFLTLYPGANILTATKDDFTPANRKEFCSRIATGNYDAVIISQSQFEKIPLSDETQSKFLRAEIKRLDDAYVKEKINGGSDFSVRSIEKSKKALQTKLSKLATMKKKDDAVSFEELGVDHLFIDESHYYKNLFYNTKMQNVAGLGNTNGSGKAFDLYQKCMYLNEKTGNRGITFATGTPISNSMAEMYTNMRYLQPNRLKQLNLENFDSWASTFGETKTQVELSPTGTGYRSKQRFAKFYNLPELMSVFKEAADIKTPDMIKLPIPKAHYVNVELEPSDYQKELIQDLGARADAIHEKKVTDPRVDNMLKITTDGRKLALDQRLFDPELPDDPNSKANACVERAFKVWEDTKSIRGTQLIFCDQSVPHGDGRFNVYDDIKQKLISKGVPASEIAFIHDATTDAQKDALFQKVRDGSVRFLLGSTDKMGAGTNVQDRLVALHHVDVPWRPSDIEQQEGRKLRQGNQNKDVQIFRYVTKGTFDAYSWQLIEGKQKFIGQIMTSKTPVRSADDVDEAVLSYAEVKALAAGNPKIREKMELENSVAKLKLERQSYKSSIYDAEDCITKKYPAQIAKFSEDIKKSKQDLDTYTKYKDIGDTKPFSITIGSTTYTEKAAAEKAILDALHNLKPQDHKPVVIGSYKGFTLKAWYDSATSLDGRLAKPEEKDVDSRYMINVCGALTSSTYAGKLNIVRLDNVINGIPARYQRSQDQLAEVNHQMEIAKEMVGKPFPREEEYKQMTARLAELNAALNIGDDTFEAVAIDDDGPDTDTPDIKDLPCGKKGKTITRSEMQIG